MEKETGSLYLVFAKKRPGVCIRPQKWKQIGSDCEQRVALIVLLPTHLEIFPPNVLCQTQKTCQVRAYTLQRGVRRYTDVMFRSQDWSSYDITSNRYIISSKNLNKHVLDQIDTGPLEEYCCGLGEKKTLRQLTKVAEHTITLLRYTNKFKKDPQSFLPKEL